MPKVRHFRGILYNRNLVDISKVAAPPYDVISPEKKRYYQSLSEYNIVDLLLEDELPDDSEVENKYTRTARCFKEWLNSDILIRDEVPGFYVYVQEYRHENELKTRIGFIGLLKIADEDEEVMPHENTFEKTRTDRFMLLKEVRANLSPIFSVFDDPHRQVENLLADFVSRNKPRITIHTDGVTHKILNLTDDTLIKEITEYFKNTHLFIADGHHRYESAGLYRKFMHSSMSNFTGDESFNFLMSYFVGDTDEGLTILPSHRILSGVGLQEIHCRMTENFLIKEVESYEKMVNKMRKAMNDGESLMGFYDGRNFGLLRLKDGKQPDENISEILRELDVTILHSLLIPKTAEVQFTRDSNKVISTVKSNPNNFGFFINPVEVECVKNVALSGERMPHKSTYFYPKLLSGLVINRLD